MKLPTFKAYIHTYKQVTAYYIVVLWFAERSRSKLLINLQIYLMTQAIEEVCLVYE